MNLTKRLKEKANPEKAKILARFFKTGPGEYGEGDVFLGINVPEARKIAREFLHLSLGDIERHLNSKIHEERLAALLILVEKFKKGEKDEKKELYDFYRKNAKMVNNWDLVDLSADKIIGEYLHEKEDERKILYKLAKSDNLWERRIAIISTFAFIRKNDFSDSLAISEIMLKDKHDLIQKAVGWMLREIGNRNQKIEKAFLRKHYKKMPRVMLRYAIERFPEGLRKKYMR